jgi:hypothetical protein
VGPAYYGYVGGYPYEWRWNAYRHGYAYYGRRHW